MTERLIELAVVVDRVIDQQQRNSGGSLTPKERAHLAGFLLGIAMSVDHRGGNPEMLLRHRIVDWYRYRVSIERLLP